ncbi:SCO family protein [Oceanobacter mangrovi]|uniref:SCO family protein n=1 Tax=Oceanobacter mangrovi TaxID=2862510 RepID=UPI001C8EE447|nr:SCO family protein [Oceanobacter mangrovi]
MSGQAADKLSPTARSGLILLALGLLVSLSLGLWMGINSSPVNWLSQQTGVMLYRTGQPVSDFQFIDQFGNKRNQASLNKRWKLVFFGYTFCPDICPTTLADMNRVWKKLTPAEREQLQLVFVSIDPERDTVASLQPYLNYFNPEFIGLTGNKAALKTLALEINGFYARVDRETGPYLMDHSANLMLIDQHWQYRGYIEPPFSRDRMQSILEAVIKQP